MDEVLYGQSLERLPVSEDPEHIGDPLRLGLLAEIIREAKVICINLESHGKRLDQLHGIGPIHPQILTQAGGWPNFTFIHS